VFSQAEEHMHDLWLEVCSLIGIGDSVQLRLDEPFPDAKAGIHLRTPLANKEKVGSL
jgi:hypothetical protein